VRKLACFMLICLAVTGTARAQGTDANPVTASVKEIYSRHSKYIAAAAAEMPADKYGYHPTLEQWTFGRIIAHVAQANFAVCSMISDVQAPSIPKPNETDPKETLAVALKASFDFCDQALAKLQDANMGDSITFFGGVKKPRSRAVMELVADLNDHYSQLASCLRLNGMLPPSVKPQP
jgi:hypothetical protein